MKFLNNFRIKCEIKTGQNLNDKDMFLKKLNAWIKSKLLSSKKSIIEHVLYLC